MPFYVFWGVLPSVHIPCASLLGVTSKAIYKPFFRSKQTVLCLYVPQGLFLLHPRGDEGVWASNKLGCFRRCQHRRTFAPLGAYLDFQICNSCLADPNGFFLSWAWNFLCWEDSVARFTLVIVGASKVPTYSRSRVLSIALMCSRRTKESLGRTSAFTNTWVGR